MSASRRLLVAALVTLGLAAAHHIYGGIVYGTAWRLHGAAVALALCAPIAWLSHRRSGWPLLGVVAITCVLGIGLFEGAYNHVAKDILYAARAPRALLVRMFPPPTYEPADDLVFELSGIGEAIAGAWALVAGLRFARTLQRARSRLAVGTVLPARQLAAITGVPIALLDPVRGTHLQFRRFAGCPICSLHLRTFVVRHAELIAAGLREALACPVSADTFHPTPDLTRFTITAFKHEPLSTPCPSAHGRRPPRLSPGQFGAIAASHAARTLPRETVMILHAECRRAGSCWIARSQTETMTQLN